MILNRWLGITIIALIGLTAAGTSVRANPINPTVGSGSVAFEGLGTGSLTVNQASHKAIINWQSFNIAANEVTRFVQPSSSSMALNRIGDIHPSLIFGSLQANGHVLLLNPNGILFGPSAQVNVGGLVATSLNISDQNFLSGNYLFQGTAASGAVSNYGTIRAESGGVYLLAPKVENGGLIESPEGHVALAGGSSVYLSDRPDGKGLLVEVTAPDGEAVNLKDLIADGGQVSLIGRVVSQQGLVQANSVRERNGKIELFASEQLNLKSGSQTLAMGDPQGVSPGGTILAVADTQSGTATFEQGAVLNASGGPQGGDGGFIELSGHRVNFGGSFVGGAAAGWQRGRLLIDPVELTVDTSLLTSALMSGMDPTFTTSTGDLVVTANLDLNSVAASPPGQEGTMSFIAGDPIVPNTANLIFQNASIRNSATSSGNRWNITGTAKGNIEFSNSIVTTRNTVEGSTWRGGNIDFRADQDIKLTGGAPSYVWAGGTGVDSTGTGTSNVTMIAGRDIVAPSTLEKPSWAPAGIMSGVRVDNGTLTMTAGRDILGGTVNGISTGPGFSLQNGTATVTAGGNFGSGTVNPVDGTLSCNCGTLTLGGARLLANRFIVNGTLGETHVTLNAGGSVFLGLAQDGGLTQGIVTGRVVTANPLSELKVTAQQGDIHLKPMDDGKSGFNTYRTLYPANFTAEAEQGSVFVHSNVGFWPSPTGRVELLAHDRLEGISTLTQIQDDSFVPRLPDGRPLSQFTLIQLLQMGLTQADIAQLSNPPVITVKGGTQAVTLYPGDLSTIQGQSQLGTIGTRLQTPAANVPPQAPVPVTFSTQTGDISGLNFNVNSPSYQKQVTISSGRDLREFRAQISVPEGTTAVVRADRDINMLEVGSAGASGIAFYGKGTGLVQAGRNLNLANSTGITHALEFTQQDTTSGNPGLLRLEVGGDLDMTKTQIITQNGASISIHGRPLDLTTPGGQIALGTDGVPLAEQGQLIGNVLHDAQGNPVLVGGNPVVLDGTQAQVVRTTDFQEGNALVPALTVNGVSIRESGQVASNLSLNGLALPTLNGQTVSPVLSAAGKPIVVNGKVVLESGGQIILADAGYGRTRTPLGGNINVGTNAGAGGVADRGIITRRGGAIDIWANGSVNVNTSRIASLGGGDIAIATVSGDISAGSGGKDEVIPLVFRNPVLDQFGNQVKDSSGNPLYTFETFNVPGSGIFTFHRDDPFPLAINFPQFDTPAITALKQQIAKAEFFGRDATALRAEQARLEVLRTPEYAALVDAVVAPFKLGDISLQSGRDVIIPPAGIRGRLITIDAGRNVVFAGGEIVGKVTITGGTIQGKPLVVGSIVGASGGVVASGSASGGSSLGGLTGLGGGVAAPTSASSSTSSTASGSAKETKESTESAADVTSTATKVAKQLKEEKKMEMAKSVRLKKGVTIQVEAKSAAQ